MAQDICVVFFPWCFSVMYRLLILALILDPNQAKHESSVILCCVCRSHRNNTWFKGVIALNVDHSKVTGNIIPTNLLITKQIERFLRLGCMKPNIKTIFSALMLARWKLHYCPLQSAQTCLTRSLLLLAPCQSSKTNNTDLLKPLSTRNDGVALHKVL